MVTRIFFVINPYMISYKKFNSSPKIIFLDTNFLNEIVHNFTREKIKRNQKIEKLYEVLQEKVINGKIICPFLHQRSEYYSTKKREIADDILVRLSKGNQIRSYITPIKQMERAVEHYLNKSTEINFTWEDILRKPDGVKKENPYGIEVVVLWKYDKPEEHKAKKELLSDHMTRRKDLLSRMDGTYEDKFNKIYNEEVSARKIMFIQAMSDSIKQFGGIPKYQYMTPPYMRMHPFYVWENKAGNNDLESLRNFVESDWFIIPIDEISSKLVTKKLIDNSNVKPTDAIDIEALSILLPYTDIVLADKEMAINLKQLKLDSRFSSTVYHYGDIDSAISKIGSL